MVVGQILVIALIIFLAVWGISIVFSKNFWKSVGGHVKDGIAKKISKAIIWLIFFSIIVLVASLMQKR